MPHQTVDKPGESTVERFDTDRIPEVAITEEDLRNTQDDPESWLLYGGGYRNHRHTTADVITPENVGSLELEYTINIGVTPGEYQGTPLIVPGDPPIMYQTNGPDNVRAIDARTGDVLWRWVYEPVSQIGDTPAQRGVTVLGDRLYVTTLDMGILALDRYTADEVWHFNQAAEYVGEQAEGDLHSELMFARSVGFASSIPPIPYEGTLLKGSFGGEYGVRGWIDAVDTEGNHQWRFATTPKDQWVGDSWRHGSTTVWQPPAVDVETGTAFFPTSNPGPDFDATVRPGWNPYSAGKLALDVETGEYQWHYQESPHDWWDYDSPSPPIVFDAEEFGEERTFVSWPGKTGWLFTADAEDGRLVERSQPYVQHIDMWTLPPFEDLEAAPWSAPNLTGGTDPQPPAFDPDRRVAIVKGSNRPWKLSWTSSEYQQGQLYWSLHGLEFAEQDADIEGWNNSGGVIAGIDPLTGEVVWQQWLPLEVWGSALTTTTGLTFAGTSGVPDAAPGKLVAYRTETGEQLWSHDLGPGVGGDPVSWYDPGTEKQYVAVQAGGEGPGGGFGDPGDLLAVFSMEATTETPTATRSPTPVDQTPTPTDTETPTETGTPGFGVLSAIAGAGAAAAEYLRRKTSGTDDED